MEYEEFVLTFSFFIVVITVIVTRIVRGALAVLVLRGGSSHHPPKRIGAFTSLHPVTVHVTAVFSVDIFFPMYLAVDVHRGRRQFQHVSRTATPAFRLGAATAGVARTAVLVIVQPVRREYRRRRSDFGHILRAGYE